MHLKYDECERADRKLALAEDEIDGLRARIAQLTTALQALADAADARLRDNQWIPLLNARRVLGAGEGTDG